MKLLLGVAHEPQYLGSVKRVIEQELSSDPRSMMLELPSDLEKMLEIYVQLGARARFENNFFLDLAINYQEKGTKIICGDSPVGHFLGPYRKGVIEKLRDMAYPLRGATDAFTFRKRDANMVRAIKEHGPEVVVVGRRHADYIKKEFPDAKYVAFSIKNGPQIYKAWENMITDKSLPEKIIPLMDKDYPIPCSYTPIKIR